jgi:large subunit ribosomal protein L28
VGEQHGSIDNYLLRTKPDLLGIEGMRLRILVREKLDIQRAEDEAAAAAQAEEEAMVQLEKEKKEAKRRRKAQVGRASKLREAQQTIVGGVFGSTGSSTSQPTAS